MKVDVTTEIVIHCPREAVAAFASDPDNAPRWYENIKSVEWQSARPLQRGSRIAFVAEFIGRRLAYTYEVTEFIPAECFIMRTAEGPFPMQTTYRWESIAGGATPMTLRNNGEAFGFSALLAPFMQFAIRRANNKDLARLKALLERGT